MAGYNFLYCSDIIDEPFEIISTHPSYHKAKIAKDEHKRKRQKEYDEFTKNMKVVEFPFGYLERWKVEKC